MISRYSVLNFFIQQKSTMRPSKIWYLASTSSLLFVIISNIDLVLGFYIKPIYIFFLYWFYYRSIKKHNIPLIIFQLSALISEVYFLKDLDAFFSEVMIFYIIATAMMFFTFIPILKMKSQEIKNEMLIEPILGVVFCTYIIIHLLTVFYESVPNKPLFIFSGVLLWIFTIVCTLIPLRNRHPYNFDLYIIAAALLIECILGFMHHYSIDNSLLLTTLNIAICVHKAAVTSYFVKIIKIQSDNSYYY